MKCEVKKCREAGTRFVMVGQVRVWLCAEHHKGIALGKVEFVESQQITYRDIFRKERHRTFSESMTRRRADKMKTSFTVLFALLFAHVIYAQENKGAIPPLVSVQRTDVIQNAYGKAHHTMQVCSEQFKLLGAGTERACTAMLQGTAWIGMSKDELYYAWNATTTSKKRITSEGKTTELLYKSEGSSAGTTVYHVYLNNDDIVVSFYIEQD
jgi:hypothetical protein